MNNMRVFLKSIYILFFVNIILPAYSQENNLFRPTIIGLSIDEIMELEGEYYRSWTAPNDTTDGTYIRQIAYGRRYFAEYNYVLYFWFIPDEKCHGYAYWLFMSENIEYNMEMLNSISGDPGTVYREGKELRIMP